MASDTQIKFFLISAEDVKSDSRFWADIKRAITPTTENTEPLKTESHPSHFSKWRWIALTSMTLVLIILIPFQMLRKRPQNFKKKSENQIVLKSIKIEEAPAKTYFFQTKNPNRLIIWAKKAD
jgi:hypothetical protein